MPSKSTSELRGTLRLAEASRSSSHITAGTRLSAGGRRASGTHWERRQVLAQLALSATPNEPSDGRVGSIAEGGGCAAESATDALLTDTAAFVASAPTATPLELQPEAAVTPHSRRPKATRRNMAAEDTRFPDFHRALGWLKKNLERPVGQLMATSMQRAAARI